MIKNGGFSAIQRYKNANSKNFNESKCKNVNEVNSF